MRRFMAVTALLLLSLLVSAQDNVTTSPLTRVFVTPVRVVWKSEAGVSGEQFLLQKRPLQTELGTENTCEMLSTGSNTASIILDFGKELQGGLQLVMGQSVPHGTPFRVRLRFGESVSETCSDTINEGERNTATNDHAMRDFEQTVTDWGRLEIGNTGFRFLRIDLLTKDVAIHIKNASAIYEFRDIPELGSFRSSDERLNEIWKVGAHTVHLNMQDYLWDGIKRDRLIWFGDMHPEVATIMAVYGMNEVVPESMDLGIVQFPLPHWLNNMSAYSLWYLIIHHDWYMHGGDRDFLDRHWDYIRGVIDQVSSRVDENGVESLADARFLDWPSSPNVEGVESGFRALICWSMTEAAELCRMVGDEAYARKCDDVRARMMKKVKDPAGLKQAAALMSIAGIPYDGLDTLVAKGGPEGFSTFYGYYMLQALAQAGRYEEAMDVIRCFWGGMLDVGATSFWEDFDLSWTKNAFRIDEMPVEGKVDIHGDYGAYCYKGFRHSLCHGWASGPTAWLSEHVLGVKVLEPGCRKVSIEPHLGTLEWVEGTYPTPYGVIKIRHERGADGKVHSVVKAPKEVKIVKNK